MNDRELRQHLVLASRSLPPDIKKRIWLNVETHIAAQPSTKTRRLYTSVTTLGVLLAIVSLIAVAINPYMAILSISAVCLLGIARVVRRYYYLHPTNFLLRTTSIVLLVIGLTISVSSSTYAVIKAPEIAARLVGVTAKEKSSTSHTELQFEVSNCPGFGFSRTHTDRRYVLSNQATIGADEAEKVVKAQCFEDAARHKVLREIWPSLNSRDQSYKDGQEVSVYGVMPAVPANNITKFSFDQIKQKSHSGQFKLVDSNGRAFSANKLQETDIVVPVFESRTTIYISVDTSGKRSAIPRSSQVPPTVVGAVVLPRTVEFKYYNAMLRSQLVLVQPCLHNVQDDCVAPGNSSVLFHQTLSGDEARIQGRVTSYSPNRLTFRTQPSGREFTLELTEPLQSESQLQVGAYLEVRYRASSATTIKQSDISWIYVLKDVIKKHGPATPF